MYIVTCCNNINSKVHIIQIIKCKNKIVREIKEHNIQKTIMSNQNYIYISWMTVESMNCTIKFKVKIYTVY